jgi:hypothetical protein
MHFFKRKKLCHIGKFIPTEEALIHSFLISEMEDKKSFVLQVHENLLGHLLKKKL